MKYIRLFSLLLTMLFISNLSAQNLQLTDSAKSLGFEVFLMPGIGPSGEKIFKFSFARLSTFNGHVSRDSISFAAASGKTINMFSPVKTKIRSENVKSNSSIFALAPSEIGILKTDDIQTMFVYVNGQRQGVPITKANAAAIKSLSAKHF